MTTNHIPAATFYAAKAAHLTNMAAKATTPKIGEAYRLMANRMADMALRAEGQIALCTCPSDCNCHYSWKTNFCGCRQHGE